MDKNFFLLFLITTTALTAMDVPHPQLQLGQPKKKQETSGTLSITPRQTRVYPHRTCKKTHPVEYITQEHRKLLSENHDSAQIFEHLPLYTPFVHIYVESPLACFFTIIPAYELINCTDGSKKDLSCNRYELHLSCVKNDDLITNINREYFPKDKQGNTFETQFLTLMNQFYGESPYCVDNQNISELVQNKILHERIEFNVVGNLAVGIIPLITWSRTHGIHGCSSPQDLIDIATQKTTKPYGGTFNFVMNRQLGLSRAQIKK